MSSETLASEMQLPRQAPYVSPDPNTVTAICFGRSKVGLCQYKRGPFAKCQVLNSTISRELQILRSHVIITDLFLSKHYSSRPFTVLHSPHTTNIHTPHCRAALQASVYTTPHLNPNILHLRPVTPIMAISPPISAPPNVAEETMTNSITSHTLAYQQEDIERRHTIRKMKSSSNLHDIFRREGGCRRGPTSQVRSAASYSSL